MLMLLGLLIGIAFGFIIHRAGASQYENILNTLRLKDLKILKFMVFSIAVGMVGVYFLNIFGLAHFSIKASYVLGVALGGLIFGIGFALAGYCPGTAVCALGERKKDALVAILGGLVGVLAYSSIYAGIKPLLIDKFNLGKITLANIIPLPEFLTALIVAIILALIVFILPNNLIDDKK